MGDSILTQKKPEVSAAKLARAKWLANYTRKWILGLLWLAIPNGIANVLTTNTTLSSIDLVNNIGTIVGYLCAIVEIFFLIKLREDEDEYFQCVLFGIGALITYGISEILYRVGVSDMYLASLIFEAVAVVLTCLRIYHECSAHASVMYCVDDDISKKWLGLWKWQITGVVGVFVAGLLLIYQRFDRVLITVRIGLILGPVMLVVSGIAGILRMVYLEKSAKAMREYEKYYRSYKA